MIMNKFLFNKFWVGCITAAAIGALTEGQYGPGLVLVALIFWQAGVEKWAAGYTESTKILQAEKLNAAPTAVKNEPFKTIV